MRLWVDGQCFQTASRLRGIGRYVHEFTRCIVENHPEVELLISFNAAMGEAAIEARDVVSGWIKAENIYVWHGASEAGETIEGHSTNRQLSHIALAHHVNCLKPNVALSTSPFEGFNDIAVPLLPGPFCAVPIASIFYDAIPLHFPERYLADTHTLACYKRRLAAFGDFSANLCISEFSRNELLERHPHANAVNIVAGVSSELSTSLNERELTDSQQKYGSYVLYVGGLDWRKNVGLIIDAFALLPSTLRNRYKLVLAGDHPKGLVSQLISQWNKYNLLPDNLVCVGHVSEQELASLYKGALALVQPSFMEGFGLTALEAITCGTPALAARAGALPEVVGDEAALFDPSSSQQLSALLYKLMVDTSFRQQLLARGAEQASRFSWTKSASIALEALKKIAADNTALPDKEISRQRIAREWQLTKSQLPLAARTLSLAEPLEQESPRLIVDATSTTLVDHATGIQRVVKNICREFARQDTPDGNKIISYCVDENGWLDTGGKLRPPTSIEPTSRVRFRNSDTILMLDSSWELYQWHGTYLCGFRIRGMEIVSCLYDMVPLRTPAFCDPNMPVIFSQWFRSALTHSTGFVCISRAVADELYAMLEAVSFPHRMKIGYWQLGADFVGGGSDGPADALQQTKPAKLRPVVLMVGTLEPRKGHRVALDAFESLWLAGVDVELVIVGKKGWGVQALADRIRGHPEYGRHLVWHEGIDDATLRGLYESCDVLLAASFAEGFGLPIVEAGYFGKPLIASDLPVFREVAKGAVSARFFKTGSAEDLADAVRDFLAEADARHENLPRSKWPNWRESADQLDDVVLGGNWYRVYEPREQKDYVAFGDLGRIRMETPLEPSERVHALRLVEGPVSEDNGSTLKFIVGVTNLSSKIWSSDGRPDGNFRVALSYHILTGNGKMLQFDNPRVHIPFVHLPGDVHYMALAVPADWKARGARYVDIEMLQEGVAWFGKPLRVAL
ncbi:glycosyltransferase family 1 protein [Hyphomicrobium sp. LHD-15]|uniref:glycosyltransferase family 4 protein n=1 Tax=Hyphomicrobium sp. LHD-15 TaxID=3072142 RepID=UPI0028106B23|nr:glycosyltransferase family 1 protein [Hyphomicrobium sp. LHD-15]MDQ8699884.1 glycosyltransferase family 1 protein [Hyphomicrobium sp. LHD-15]